MDPMINSHVFLVEHGGEQHPVCGVRNNKVCLQLPDDENLWKRPERFDVDSVQLPPVGRLTLFFSKGNSRSETHVGEHFINNFSSSTIEFDLVADRPLENVYAVLFLRSPDESRTSLLFGKVGSLPAGERVTRATVFPQTIPGGSTYEVEFYVNGFPVEQFKISQVALDPKSSSLLISWEDRLEFFRELSEQSARSGPPLPFAARFSAFDREACRADGWDTLRVKIRIKSDGKVEYLGCEPELSAAQSAKLAHDVGLWRFFPAAEAGALITRNAALPVSL